MTAISPTLRLEPAALVGAVVERVEAPGRFAGLFATARPSGSTELLAVVATDGRLDVLQAHLAPGVSAYPALTPRVPGAYWYEREIHDLFGLVPEGHPRLDPLVLPLAHDAPRPRPGAGQPGPGLMSPDESPLPGLVSGEGLFTIPYGPVRSGVFESVEYLVETPGEDIANLRVRVHHKHRGIEGRFEGRSTADGVLVAERVEGVASVAHAIAYCQAVEGLAGVVVPAPAQLVRVVHAELERVANHLESVIRHTEASGQAVAYARLTLHKERVLRLHGFLCGHRFGRGVVVPGGVANGARLEPDEIGSALDKLARDVDDDLRLLMATPSFLDRLRGTGRLSGDVAASRGALGPVGRGSGLGEDVRRSRPYGAYSLLGFEPAEARSGGDALARQNVRLDEIRTSLELARRAVAELGGQERGPWRVPVVPPDGLGVGWAEAPQGEVLYLVESTGRRLARVKPRSASFHNLALLASALRGDVFTDFAFVEASFGVSIAGVAG